MRLFDLTFASVALLLKLDSTGSAFYRAERIGWDGEPFGMVEFRSMVTDADKLVGTLMSQNEGAGLLLAMC